MTCILSMFWSSEPWNPLECPASGITKTPLSKGEWQHIQAHVQVSFGEAGSLRSLSYPLFSIFNRKFENAHWGSARGMFPNIKQVEATRAAAAAVQSLGTWKASDQSQTRWEESARGLLPPFVVWTHTAFLEGTMKAVISRTEIRNWLHYPLLILPVTRAGEMAQQ